MSRDSMPGALEVDPSLSPAPSGMRPSAHCRHTAASTFSRCNEPPCVILSPWRVGFLHRRAEKLLAGSTNRYASIPLASAPLLLLPCCHEGGTPCFSRPRGAWAILHPTGRGLARGPPGHFWAYIVISEASGLPAACWRQSMRAGVMPMLSCPHLPRGG